MKKKILWLSLGLLLVAAGWRYRFYLSKFGTDLLNLEKSISENSIISNIKPELLTPPPLKSSENFQNSILTVSGVISWTNIERKDNGSLVALKENSKLDQAAELKVKDMFTKQYFEHVSPEGIGPSGLAQQVSYSYIALGENLASGNFKNDQALVEAWMNSPGHRENILNKDFKEIGVAVKKGVLDGKTVWLAVQEFGRPSSDCPAVNSSLKISITNGQNEVTAMETQLKVLKAQIDASDPKNKQEVQQYNSLVAQYNNMVKIYNNKVDVLKQLVLDYNSQVNAYNACAS